MGQRGYILGVGSNLEPEKNAGLIITKLVERFGAVLISRIYYTAPVKIESDHRFVNFGVFVPTELDPAAFKAACVAIEVELGRDRNNPLRKILDRPADLDVLVRLSGEEKTLNPELIIPAEYLAEPARELVAVLGLGGKLPGARGELCPIAVGTLCLGQTPAAVDRDDRAGLVVIREY